MAVESWLARDHDLDEARARDWLLGDLVADPDWAAFLHWRCRCVAELRPKARRGPAVDRTVDHTLGPATDARAAGWKAAISRCRPGRRPARALRL